MTKIIDDILRSQHNDNKLCQSLTKLGIRVINSTIHFELDQKAYEVKLIYFHCFDLMTNTHLMTSSIKRQSL